ncbi:death-associated protein kinase 1 [Aplysia californica]|uniref:Death-associated protein kinase 1 n=1 Tax=Aplysia californica TaxID=6500 RepID=A0ABM1A9M9_APLCA|nr:death-associated protein kinase 1 [Aplysia californica]
MSCFFSLCPRKRATVDDCINHAWIRPKKQNEELQRKSAVINIDNFKAFMARKRWKQSMRVVSLCNRLSRSMLLRKSTDTLGSRNTLDEERREKLPSITERNAAPDSKEPKVQNGPLDKIDEPVVKKLPNDVKDLGEEQKELLNVKGNNNILSQLGSQTRTTDKLSFSGMTCKSPGAVACASARPFATLKSPKLVTIDDDVIEC